MRRVVVYFSNQVFFSVYLFLVSMQNILHSFWFQRRGRLIAFLTLSNLDFINFFFVQINCYLFSWHECFFLFFFFFPFPLRFDPFCKLCNQAMIYLQSFNFVVFDLVSFMNYEYI